MTDATSGSRTQNAVTGADLQTVTFSTSKGFGRGYDQHEVDSFVVRCAAAVDQLRAQLRDQDAGFRAEIARLQERIERDSRSNEVAHAISVLTTAQQTADKTVAQADDYSARVMTEARDLYEDARRNAATLEQETEEKAKHVYEDALRRSETLQRETDENVAQLTLTAVTAQQELDAQTAYLRTLRDATRTQMEAFLEGLLDHVADEYGKAHPIAAEAAQATTPRRVKRSNRLAGRTAAAKSANPAVARVAAKQARRIAGASAGTAGAPSVPVQHETGAGAHGVDEFLRD